MGKKVKEIQFSFEIENFVDINNIVCCKRTQTIYKYDETTGLFRPVDDIELSKLIDDYIENISSDMLWSDYNMSIISKYVKTKAPYYDSMGRTGRIVFTNGTFNVEKRKLFKHSPKNRAIAGLEFAYDPTATCPTFDRFISQMADGDADLQMTLYEIAGYVAVGCKKACKLVILVSVGGSGKSVYLKILELLVGKDYTSNLSISEINNPNRAFDRCALLDSRLNIVHELGEKETLNSIFSANVKKIVSGEEISCEKKFGARISFTPEVSMIVVASNHSPGFESMPSESIMRRTLILNISKTFSFEEQDPDLIKKLKKELPGIFNRALEYYDILEQNHFVFASEASSRAYIDRQILETYPMYSFVKQHIISLPGNHLKTSDLRDAYSQWAASQGIFVSENKTSVTKELETTITACHFNFKTGGKSNGDRYLKGINVI